MSRFLRHKFALSTISKQFVETISANQAFQVYGILKFRAHDFCKLLGFTKTAKITPLTNLDVHVYDTHKTNEEESQVGQ